MGQKRLIHIMINGYDIPLNINPEEEELYRRAGKALSNRFNSYLNKFSTSDLVQVALMVALDFAIINQKQAFQQDINPMTEKMIEIIGKIEETLHPEE